MEQVAKEQYFLCSENRWRNTDNQLKLESNIHVLITVNVTL